MAVPVGLIAASVTIAPAMVAMWWLLRKYEEFFDDARIFFSLVIGFFAGIMLGFLETALFPFKSAQFVAQTGLPFAFAYFLVGYALLETLAKTVVLGSRSYRKRKDTPYYGVPLGLGLGAMLAMLFVTRSAQRLEMFEGDWGRDLVLLAILTLFSIGAVLAQGATGAWVGQAIIKEGSLWKGLLRGTMFLIPLTAVRWIWPNDMQGALVPALIAVVYGVGLGVITKKRVLDHVVPLEIQDRLRREKRKEAREARLAAQRGPELEVVAEEPPKE